MTLYDIVYVWCLCVDCATGIISATHWPTHVATAAPPLGVVLLAVREIVSDSALGLLVRVCDSFYGITRNSQEEFLYCRLDLVLTINTNNINPMMLKKGVIVEQL